MIDKLLDFIAEHESRGDYNIVYSGISKRLHPVNPITEMTIGQVLKWQDFVVANNAKSSAAGKYQIIRKTLRATHIDAGLTQDRLFDKAGQDALAMQLLKYRGLGAYLNGQISAETFANNLAHEWASLPWVNGPNKGRSVYAGDGLNKALAKVEPFLAAVRAAKTPVQAQPAPQATTPQKQPTSPPAGKKRGSFGVGAGIAAAVIAATAYFSDNATAWWHSITQAMGF